MELKLKNQKTTFDVQASEGALSIENARVSIGEKNDINEFSGSIFIEHSHRGNFYYSERNGRIQCNVSDVTEENYTVLHDFVHACIDAIKAQLNITPAPSTDETTNEA